MDCQHKLRWTLYSSFAAIIIILSITEIGLFTAMRSLFTSAPAQQSLKHVIVFDGGSTGTRIHVFTFINDSSVLNLQEEYFEEIKPGLSNYADYPPDAADSVNKLLNKAKTFISSNEWSNTPVSLQATAGLRLLPKHVSESIIEEVKDLYLSSPFDCSSDCVSILDGKDEGIFAWFTVNFLLDHLDEPKESVALLDLGGGSTQVSFAPTDLDSFAYSPNGYIINRRIQNNIVTIYTHSYLGLGLMSARMGILSQSSPNTDGNAIQEENLLQSPCMAPGSNTKWKHELQTYTVRGLQSGDYGFEQCYEKAVNFLNATIHKPVELEKKDVYGISYYFDRAVDLGIIDGNGGTVTVSELREVVMKECSKMVPQRPFLCLDGTYILAILQHGLGFSKQKEINLVAQIKGFETSWALGAALDSLS